VAAGVGLLAWSLRRRPAHTELDAAERARAAAMLES
jgi:hypothetical protein